MRMADLFNMKPGEASVSVVGAKLPPSDRHLASIASYVEEANAIYKDSPAAEYALRRFGINQDLGYFIGLGFDPGDLDFEFLTAPYQRVPRLVVPFNNFEGVVQGLQGRALEDDPIRWCGPRNPDGHAWSTMGVTELQGDELNFLITEGPGDRLTAIGAGFSAVGIRGAALARNADTISILSTHLQGKRIVLCGDADESGLDFNLTLGHHLATDGHQVHTLSIPEGFTDLTDWRENDSEVFTQDMYRAIRAATRIDANVQADPPGEDPDLAFDFDERPNDYFPHTDEGNAMRILGITGGLARWCPELGWLLFEEGAWVQDEQKQIQNAMSIVCQVMHFEGQRYIDIGEETDDVAMVEHGMRLQGWGRRSENSPRFEKAITHAEPKAAVSFNQLDRHDHLLVVKNGVVDLRDGSMIEHDPDLWITHKVDHNYNPQASAPRWRQFLLEIFDGDVELIDFIKRLFGYGITGSTREQCFAVFHGSGANGKSVLLGVINEIFDAIVGTAAFSAFELKNAGASTADLASLRGKRIVISQEGERSRPMAEAVIKRITGGDRITARHLYKDQMTFMPKFLLVMASNYKPRFGGQDEGLWRRVKLVPFKRYFSVDERDPFLSETLLTEIEGIVAWVIEGAIEWYEHGLEDPELIKEATKDYMETSDDLAGYCNWILIPDDSAEMKASDAYEKYRDWAIQEGIKPWAAKSVYEGICERMPSVAKKKKKDGLWLIGVRFSSEGDGKGDDASVLQTSLYNSNFPFIGEVLEKGSSSPPSVTQEDQS